ncbi:TPA: fimbrial protein, partial [Escherichia coli]|nr:fimbrial protein [Escherichia coli]
MIKSVIAGAVAMAVVSFGANAAPQGQGKVTFNGTVVDAPCGIDAQSADQSIEFGQVSKVLLNNGGSSTPKNFDIKLTDCDVTNYKNAGKMGTVSLTFSGVQAAGTDMLQTVGTTNT